MARLVFVPNSRLFGRSVLGESSFSDVVRCVKLFGHSFFQYFTQRTHWDTPLGPFECARRLEANDKNSFAFLRETEIQGIKNAAINLISHASQDFQNPRESFPSIVPREQFHVFQHKRLRLFGLKNSRYFEKKRSPCIFKSFAVSDDAEWLTREPGEQDVVIRNGGGVNRVNITGWSFPEISRIGLLTVGINIARQHAFGANSNLRRHLLDGITEPAYSTEQVNEANRLLCIGNHGASIITQDAGISRRIVFRTLFVRQPDDVQRAGGPFHEQDVQQARDRLRAGLGHPQRHGLRAEAQRGRRHEENAERV